MVIFEKPLRRACAPPREFPRVPRGCKITEFQSLEKFAAAAKQLKFQVARGQQPSKSATKWNQQFSTDHVDFSTKILPISSALIRNVSIVRVQASKFNLKVNLENGYLGQLCKSQIAMQTKSPLPDAQLQFYTRINPSPPPHPSCLIQFGFIHRC